MITDLGVWTVVIALTCFALSIDYELRHHRRYRKKPHYWLMWELSGLRFALEKIHPPTDQEKKGEDYRPPATIAVWFFGLFSLYTALFGLASQRYENAVDKIENRINAYITQLVTAASDIHEDAFKEIVEIEQLKCPVKPLLMNPNTVLTSLFKSAPYSESATLLTKVVEKYKRELANVDLSETVFVNARLKKAVLSGSDLSGVKFLGDKTNLSHAQLQDSIMTNTTLEDVKFWNANLEGAELTYAKAMRADLYNANLRGATLYYADLNNAKLLEADLQGADLESANLEKAVFRGSNLENTILHSANLKHAVLRKCNLRNADFYGAQMEGADLSRANLEGTFFSGANLQNVNIEDSLNLSPQQLCKAAVLYGIKNMDTYFEAAIKQECPDKLRKPN